MDKRFIIIHSSEIIRKGLWAILREVFHYEFILIKNIGEVVNYSGFSKTELYLFIDKDLQNLATKKFMENVFNSSNTLTYISIIDAIDTDDSKAISLTDTSMQIIHKIKNVTEKKDDHSVGMSDLSDREKDVLVQVALGLTNKEIADKLFISIHTVISHRKHITDKLGIKSISGLTVYAILNKLIDTENIDPSSLI